MPATLWGSTSAEYEDKTRPGVKELKTKEGPIDKNAFPQSPAAAAS